MFKKEEENEPETMEDWIKQFDETFSIKLIEVENEEDLLIHSRAIYYKKNGKHYVVGESSISNH